MKTPIEVQAKLDEAMREWNNIPDWEPEEKSAAGGVVVALAWVLNELENIDWDGTEAE